MKHHLTILTTAAVAALLVGSGLARAAHTGKSPTPGRLLERLAELGVTPDQKAEAKSILRDHQPTVEPLLRSFVSERRALRDLMHAETVDETAIRAQVRKLARVGADLAVERARIAHELRQVLTPAQLEKLGAMREDVDARLDQFLDQVAKRVAAD